MIRVVTEAQRIGQESERFTTPGCAAVENIPFTCAKKVCLWAIIRLKDDLTFANKVRYCVWQISQIPKIDCGRLLANKSLFNLCSGLFEFSGISTLVLCGFA
jgi:hypothetical protein